MVGEIKEVFFIKVLKRSTLYTLELSWEELYKIYGYLNDLYIHHITNKAMEDITKPINEKMDIIDRIIHCSDKYSKDDCR